MRAYLDTSALVKLLILEVGSAELSIALAGAATEKMLASSQISYVEARAAIARRERESTASMAACAMARHQLEEDWPAYAVVDVTPTLVRLAAEYAEAFALRGFDAVQLASAQTVQRTVPGPLTFMAFDIRLNRAAKLLGLELPPWAPLQ